MIFLAILVTIILSLATEINPALAPTAPCQTGCGNLTIPFPFGTSSGCYLDDSFLITCNHNFNPPKPFLNLGSIEVLDISLNGLLKVASPVASHCYHDSSSRFNGTISTLTVSKFPVSSKRNKFTAIGCDTHALVNGSVGWKQTSAGCVSWCDSIDSVVNGSCSGIGCCQTSIPKGLRDILVYIERNRTRVKSFSPCGYAFVVETEAFEFSSSDLKDIQNRKTVPVVLDWSVGILSCQEAWKNLSSFACRATHSECSDASNGIGYRCSCLRGFQGNPYLVDGCQDIDECIALEPCKGICTNLQGSYSCSCPEGFEGDGKKDGSGCHPKSQFESSSFSRFGRDGSTSALFYIVSGVLVASVGGSWVFWRRKQKKVDSLRQNLSLRNGGQLLEEILPTFSAADLEEATNNYDVNNILSDAHRFQTKYKGRLSDGQIVTIAKCDAVDKRNIRDFRDKITTLYNIDHGNIVRLLGCCLQTIAPLLICEFFELKTLHDYIHDDRLACHLSWDIGLKIASEIAGVLAYMHSYRDTQIIHGGLNSSIIILHNDYTVKMHCFDFNLLSSLSGYVGHCLGYSDPEGDSSGITVESDVYSFGVILAEILTGQNAYSDDRPQEERYLAQYFIKGQDELEEILDPRLGTDGWIDQLTEVAMLAKRCLSRCEERPTMKEVVTALENAIKRESGSTAISPNPSQERTAHRVVRKIRKVYRSVNLSRYLPIRVSSA